MTPARVEAQGGGLWRVVWEGREVMRDESHGVACAVAWALNNPEAWEPTEAYEIAEQARRVQS